MDRLFDAMCAEGMHVYDAPLTFEQCVLLDCTQVTVRLPQRIQSLWRMDLPSVALVPRRLSALELEQNPERCLDVLRYCLRKRTTFEKLRDPRWMRRAIELKMGWLEAWKPLTHKEADLLLEKTHDFAEKAKIIYWRGRHSPPVTKRKAAIKACVLRKYIPKLSWGELTRRFCPCGYKHDDDLVQSQCQPSLKSIVTMLRRLLRDCGITLPEHPTVPAPPSG